MTPRRAPSLLFDRLPWVSRAQQEHDVFTQLLRDRGVEVLYLTEMLQDALEYQPARDEAIASVLGNASLGEELRAAVQDHLDGLSPEPLAQALIAGLTPDELRTGRGLVFELLDRRDFVIDPLPNLMFCRDSSVWISDRVAVTSMAAARHRESALMRVIYEHHPRFIGTKCLYGPELEPVEGGDVILLGPSVIAAGVGERSTAAGVEQLARRVFDAGLAHTVLAVPLGQHAAGCHLDTVCTVLDVDTVVMNPALAFTLVAHTITPRPDGIKVSRPQPFLEAAAQALGIDRLKVIETGLDPLGSPGQQWDDGSNALALGPGVAVCQERNVETNRRLEASGVEVIRVPTSELVGRRGGPRGMSCPVARDPAAEPDMSASPTPGAAVTRVRRQPLTAAR
jgi:arginine deiminase